MHLDFILLTIAIALIGVLLRPIGWVAFALAVLALILHVGGIRVG